MARVRVLYGRDDYDEYVETMFEIDIVWRGMNGVHSVLEVTESGFYCNLFPFFVKTREELFEALRTNKELKQEIEEEYFRADMANYKEKRKAFNNDENSSEELLQLVYDEIFQKYFAKVDFEEQEKKVIEHFGLVEAKEQN